MLCTKIKRLLNVFGSISKNDCEYNTFVCEEIKIYLSESENRSESRIFTYILQRKDKKAVTTKLRQLSFRQFQQKKTDDHQYCDL